MRFRHRNEELMDLIVLIRNLNIVFPQGNQHNNSKEVQTIQTFLKNEILTFANTIICGMMHHNLFDSEFNYTYFKYDPQSYEAIIKEHIPDFYKKWGFRKTLEIPQHAKTFLQAIMGYEAIFQLLSDDINHRQELTNKLLELCSLPTFSEVPEHEKNRAMQMIKALNG